ncbi:MAG: glycerol-3-phosphate acyltransferase [Candidatus Kapabacteria bacterium]|nr:glycerol-3-phosphate acyltransferase [Candidatus Kapabacteria bacterium]
MNLGLLPIALIGYCIGCFPTAWIVLKLTSGKDIRDEGTGNVGARNAYDASGSKIVGISVMVIDALKGVAAIYVARLLHGDYFAAVAVAGTAVVLGHNWNVLLRFKGGRGLATATGVFAVVDPLFLVVWWITYLTGYFAIRRDVHVGSMTAIIGTAVLAWSTPDRVIRDTTLVMCLDPSQMRVFIAAVSLLLFMRHLAPIQALLRTNAFSDDDE